MTVESSDSREQYATNGTTGPWTVPFYFLANSDLRVIYTDATGADTLLVLDADYSVSGAGNEMGGTVATTTAYPSAGVLTIYRDVDFTQETEFVDGDSAPAAAFNSAFDKLTMLAQQMRDQLATCLTFPQSYTGSAELGDVPTRKGKLLGFDSVTGALMYVAAASGSALALAVQYASAAGASLVGFIQSGVSAVARTVQSKLREVEISLEDFGGIADGNSGGTAGTDNNSAITAAITALPAGGGIIKLGPGYYKTSPFTIAGLKHVTIKGHGSSQAANAGGATEIVVTTGSIAFDAAKCSLRNLNVRGATGHAGDLVQIGHTTGGNVNSFFGDDVGFYGAGQDGCRIGLDAGCNADSFRFDNCRFTSNGRHGVFVSDSSVNPNANAGLFSNCVAQSNGSDGIRYGYAVECTGLGGVQEGNAGCGIRFVLGSNSNKQIGGDQEANTGTANISVESGAVNTQLIVSELFERINDAGTNTRIDAPSSSNNGWVAKGPFRMYMGDNSGASDIISGAGSGYLRMIYGSDSLTDANSHVTVSSAGLRLGKSTSGLLGHFDATPIAKQTTAIGAASFADSGSTVIHTSSTFDGYTLSQVVRALRLYGLLQ